MAMTQSSTMVGRMIRAAKLEPAVFEEAEHNPGLTNEAIAVVILVAALTGVGGLIAGIFGGMEGNAILNLIGGILQALVAFLIWAALTYFVGTRFFGGTADHGELIRTLGYAYTPNLLAVLVFIPILGVILAFAGAIWALAAGVVAIRQALDFTTGKAILTVVISWLISVIISIALAIILGAGAGLMGA